MRDQSCVRNRCGRRGRWSSTGANRPMPQRISNRLRTGLRTGLRSGLRAPAGTVSPRATLQGDLPLPDGDASTHVVRRWLFMRSDDGCACVPATAVHGRAAPADRHRRDRRTRTGLDPVGRPRPLRPRAAEPREETPARGGAPPHARAGAPRCLPCGHRSQGLRPTKGSRAQSRPSPQVAPAPAAARAISTTA